MFVILIFWEIRHGLGTANFFSISIFKRKTVKMKSSVAKLIYVALGKRKSEGESESTEVTSGMSTDEEEEKKKQKRKKLLKHKDKKREKKGKGMYNEWLPLYTICTVT